MKKQSSVFDWVSKQQKRYVLSCWFLIYILILLILLIILLFFYAVSNDVLNYFLRRPPSKEDEGTTRPGPSASSVVLSEEDSNPTPPLSGNQDSATTSETLKDRLRNLTEPIQPKNITFPARLIGGRQRHFQVAWFNKYPWLHYDMCTDSAFCYTCVKANQTNALSASKADAAFVTKGFTNWKKALTKDGFGGHELSHAHREATLRMVKAPAEYGNVGVNLSEKFLFEQINNRKMLLKILSNVRYLGKFHQTRNLSVAVELKFYHYTFYPFKIKNDHENGHKTITTALLHRYLTELSIVSLRL